MPLEVRVVWAARSDIRSRPSGERASRRQSSNSAPESPKAARCALARAVSDAQVSANSPSTVRRSSPSTRSRSASMDSTLQVLDKGNVESAIFAVAAVNRCSTHVLTDHHEPTTTGSPERTHTMTDTQNTPVEQATEAVSALRVVDGVTLPAAGTYVLDPMHTRIGFVARHLMVTKVRGSFREFT